MPQIEPTYQCDFPQCQNIFPMNQGIGLYVGSAQLGLAPVDSQVLPPVGAQTLCCSMTHAHDLASIALTTLVTQIESACTAVNFPLVIDVPAPGVSGSGS